MSTEIALTGALLSIMPLANMLRAFLRPVLLLPLLHVQSLTAEETVNGATGAINSTIPTSTENEATIYTILVGKEHNIYTPNSINPGPGDIVSFQFYPGNHSVIRAEYGYPCIPYEDLQGKENQGFYSGEMAVTEDQVNEGNVCSIILIAMQSRSVADHVAASNLESDDQHHHSDILLLWVCWWLRRVGNDWCLQC